MFRRVPLALLAVFLLAASSAAAGGSSFSFSYSGGNWGVGYSYSSHYRPHYRPVCKPVYRPHYRPHYRPYYRPVCKPVYRPVCTPVYRPVCPPPRPVYVHRPYYYPASTVSWDVGYRGSNTSVRVGATHDAGVIRYGTSSRNARNWTSYSDYAETDGRTFEREATYYKDRLVSSRSRIVDDRPSPGELQPGTNYTRDGRLVYPPRETQAVRAVDQRPNTATPSTGRTSGSSIETSPAARQRTVPRRATPSNVQYASFAPSPDRPSAATTPRVTPGPGNGPASAIVHASSSRPSNAAWVNDRTESVRDRLSTGNSRLSPATAGENPRRY